MSKAKKARLFAFIVSIVALLGTLSAGTVEFARKGFSLDLALAIATTAIIAASCWSYYRRGRDAD